LPQGKGRIIAGELGIIPNISPLVRNEGVRESRVHHRHREGKGWVCKPHHRPLINPIFIAEARPRARVKPRNIIPDERESRGPLGKRSDVELVNDGFKVSTKPINIARG
jgi:hypothetical protein